jgi:endonuclease YncB( thermonuclease family)
MRTINAMALGVLLCVATCALGEEFTGTVSSVSSGYIFQVEHDGVVDLVRLNGVTCPWTTSEAGGRAKAFTIEKIQGKKVLVNVIERNERIVKGKAQLESGEDLSEILLTSGLAAWDGKWCADAPKIQELQAKAKEQKVGLWAPKDSSKSSAAKDGIAAPVTLDDITTSSGSSPGAVLADEDGGLNSSQRNMVLKGNRTKDTSIVSPDNPALLAERERKRKAREKALISRENAITQQGRSLNKQQGGNNMNRNNGINSGRGY